MNVFYGGDCMNPGVYSKELLRKKAELMVNQSKNEILEEIDDMSREDVYEILHELRVHQAELEIQNEELKEKQLGLEVSRVRYFDLYNLAPVGYLTISEGGLILDANIKAASLFDTCRSDLINNTITVFIEKRIKTYLF